jgi:hypothetical protein
MFAQFIFVRCHILWLNKTTSSNPILFEVYGVRSGGSWWPAGCSMSSDLLSHALVRGLIASSRLLSIPGPLALVVLRWILIAILPCSVLLVLVCRALFLILVIWSCPIPVPLLPVAQTLGVDFRNSLDYRYG